MDKITAMVAAYSISWEGCLSISISHHKREDKSYIELIPSVSIVGTDKELLNNFCLLTSYGKVYSGRRENSLKNSRAIFCWRISGAKNMKSFCEEILPYLPSKRRQAEIMIEFCSRRKYGGTHTKRGYHSSYTSRDIDNVLEMSQLNKRGLATGTRYSELKEVDNGSER